MMPQVRHGTTRKAKVRPFIPATARVREFRARKKRHAMLITIEIPEGLADALVHAKYLQEWDSENPPEIRKAIEQVLMQLLE
jgi:hypothetical protein